MKKELLIDKNLNQIGINYNQQLEKKMGIKVKKVDNYYLYRYNQLDKNCDFTKQITQECRSIIFKQNSQDQITPNQGNSSTKILPQFSKVCVPFYKFFNYNEPIAEKLYNEMKDKDLYAYEKIDGAMIMLWFDEIWHISTSGNIDASQAPISNPSSPYKTYEEMFKACAARQNLNFDKLDKNCTYIFEMIGKYIRIVVPYNIPNGKIYHIGTRNNITLKEDFDFIGVEQPKVFKAKGMIPIMKYIQNLTINDENFEGLVVRDDDFNRLKVKPDIYFHLSTMKNNGDITPKRIINMIMNGDDTEFISYFPEYQEDVNLLKSKIFKLQEKLEKEIVVLFKYSNEYLIKNRKLLVEQTKDNCLQPYILQAANEIIYDKLKKENIKEYVQNVFDILYKNRRATFINLIQKF